MNDIFRFSKRDIERLLAIEAQLKLHVDKAEYAGNLDKSDTPVDDFVAGMNRYSDRQTLFEYQIFSLIEVDDWKERLALWVNCICPSDERPYIHYYTLLLLHNTIHCLIPGNYDGWGAARKMTIALCDKWGYTDGLKKIEQLIPFETNQSIRKELQDLLVRQNAFDRYKERLVTALGHRNRPFDELTQELVADSLDKKSICDFYQAAIFYAEFDLDVKGNESISDQIADYLDYFEEQG